MEQDQQQIQNQISIEDLELSLEVYQLESDQKLEKLKTLFLQKQSLDLRQTFYEQRSSLQVKFQNIVGDLTQFLVNQEVPSTQKLRKTFYRILQSPLLLLFKVSRFQIFNLRFNAFDIELDPIDAINQLAMLLYKTIDEYIAIKANANTKRQFSGSSYQSYQIFLQQSKINLIQDQIFILYSYLRKGTQILKNKIEDKVKIIQIFNWIQEKLILILLQNEDTKTLKELATLNYQIYLLQNKFDVLCFYLKIPMRQVFKQIFKELQTIALKSRTTSNYDIFIFIFVKYCKQIMAKLTQQKIDVCYASYIQNTLTTIIQLWSIRICHFKEFLDIFKLLFNLYPDQKKILQIILKHSPNLQKQDIALLRANYKHDIQQGQAQLLSLLKKVTLDDINDDLCSFYHRILYNLDFQQNSLQQIMQFLTLINGNSSVQQFFFTVQKAFKQWNHTIDFNHQHKYIQSQFKLPKLKQSALLESIKLFKNICFLQNKGFRKDYQTLISKGTTNKALIGLSNFFVQNQEASQFLKQNPFVQSFIIVAFQFLQKSLNSQSQEWQKLATNFSNILQILTKQNRIQLKQSLQKFMVLNIELFSLRKCLQIYRKVYQSQDLLSCNHTNDQLLSKIVNIFMKETQQNNQYIKKFRFIDSSAQKLKMQKITKSQSQFLQKNCVVQNGKIKNKQTGCFKLSQLQIITNPIQFQRAMDNYYFTLDGNSKRFIQFLIVQWHQTLNKPFNKFYSDVIVTLIKNYPICIPILSNVRISCNQNDKQNTQVRFIQYISTKLQIQNANSKQIMMSILNCEVIRYRNGKNYITQQIAPMILKKILNIINLGSMLNISEIKIESYEILVHSLSKSKLSDIKTDIIQKSIQKVNYQILNSSCERTIAKLSKCHFEMLYIFFLKKQLDLKKQNLASTYKTLIWNQVRSYSLAGSSNSQISKKQTILPKIYDQIMISPFTLSQQYNLEQYKIKKYKNENKTTCQTVYGQSEQVLHKMEVRDITSLHSAVKTSNLVKQIDLSKMSLNLFYHLGQSNVRLLQKKQNILIKQKYQIQTNDSTQKGLNQQNIQFIQYYLREMINPEIQYSLATKTILSILKQNLEVSYIWTNPKNLQKIFISLVALIQYSTSKNVIDPKAIKNKQIQNIIQEVNKDKIKALKNVITAFSQIGYTNLWGQNYKSISTTSNKLQKQVKLLEQSLQIKSTQEQSFLAILLKCCLQQSQTKSQLNEFLEKIFSTRPKDQTVLMYKVGIDKNLLNLIMKSLQIKNLSNMSFLFHSNFNNLRLYTDQLHEGLKALNMASKTRSYNQFIQLSKQVDDQQFFGPMKLFKQNFSFFIKIQKQGYNYKKSEQIKLIMERISNSLRNYTLQNSQHICKDCDKIIEDYLKQVQILKISIANRVKSFYLVTKLRDLTYQNSVTISLMRQVLAQQKMASAQIVSEIQKVDLFSLLLEMHSQLILFDNHWNNETSYNLYHLADKHTIQRQISICSTRRFSHSMNAVYQKCDLQFDQIMQRCFDVLKMFLFTSEGKLWLKKHENVLYPIFLIKSFIKQDQANQLYLKIKFLLQNYKSENQGKQTFFLHQKSIVNDLVKSFRSVNPKKLYLTDKIVFNLDNQKIKIEDLLTSLAKKLTASETLVQTKSKQSQFFTFNKYKTSQATLEQIQVLGYIIGYCIYHNIQINLKLHTSIIAALSFNIADIDDLIDIDFKIWEDIKTILSLQDSKTQNLNFSYLFQNCKTLQMERVQLTDKGSSKKVNNLNRDQYCDLICCYVLYKNIDQQIKRLMEGILRIIPKQMISSLSISKVYSLFYGNQKKLTDQITKKYMTKIGIVTPQMSFFNHQKVQNLKDYQNIQWLQQILFEDATLLQKLWKRQSNIFILTNISSKPGIQYKNQTFMINHFQCKEQMKNQLEKLKV